MKVDKIIKNAKVFTSNVKNLNATAFAVNDGKYVYVGDEAGLKDYEGEVCDLGGAFVMPAVMDSHVHIGVPISNELAVKRDFIECSNKKECLDFIKAEMARKPDAKKYTFSLSESCLGGEKLTRYDLDSVCPDKELLIIEGEFHSAWANSLLLKNNNVNANTPDIAPGLSYYERDENGEPTGYMFEMTLIGFAMETSNDIPDEQIEVSLKRYAEFCKKMGICAVFEAGTPGGEKYHERVYKLIQKLDRQGEWPVYVDGSYAICSHVDFERCLETLRHYRDTFHEGNMRSNTLKIYLDGTLSIHTASLLTPYADRNTSGGHLFTGDEMADMIEKLDAEGFNLHLHTVGEAASRAVLDGVEKARRKLGKALKSQVTCAHLEVQDPKDIQRFAALGVHANYTPWWHAGGGSGGGGNFAQMKNLLGEERAKRMYASRSVWDTGANVCWSSDNADFDEGMLQWSPYLGMEGGITREYTKETNLEEVEKLYEPVQPASECMTHEQMLLGFTINNARQMCIADRKGSIEAGKDADYLIFDEDLTSIDPHKFSHIEPKQVFFAGKQMK